MGGRPRPIVDKGHQAIPADPSDDVGEMLRVVGLLDRLRGEPEVLAHVVRQRALHVRVSLRMRSHACPSASPTRAPRQKPPSIITTLRAGKRSEHARENEAHHGGLHVCGRGVVLLHVVGRPARAGRGVTAAEALDVQGDRQIAARGRFIDRPIAGMAERVARSRRHDHLHEGAIGGAAFDLGGGEGGVLLRYDESPARSRGSLRTHVFELPVIDGARQRRGEVEIALLHPALESCISMPCSTPLGSRCCARISSRSDPGRPSSGNASLRMPAAIMRGEVSWPDKPCRKCSPKVVMCSRQRAGMNGCRSEGLRNAGWMSQSTMA